VKKRLLVAAAVCVTAFGASTTSAWAFYCGIADKPAGAGVSKIPLEGEDPPVNAAGKPVYRGAFISAGDVDIMVRGPEHHGDSFGAANDNAIENGPENHGVVLFFE
jgi:hypothetical protein